MGSEYVINECICCQCVWLDEWKDIVLMSMYMYTSIWESGFVFFNGNASSDWLNFDVNHESFTRFWGYCWGIVFSLSIFFLFFVCFFIFLWPWPFLLFSRLFSQLSVPAIIAALIIIIVVAALIIIIVVVSCCRSLSLLPWLFLWNWILVFVV